MNQPMTRSARSARNKQKYAEERWSRYGQRGAQGVVELWFAKALVEAKARGDGELNALAITLKQFCSRYGE